MLGPPLRLLTLPHTSHLLTLPHTSPHALTLPQNPVVVIDEAAVTEGCGARLLAGDEAAGLAAEAEAEAPPPERIAAEVR